MKSKGKSINLFLIDGTANGRIKCTLSNWTGLAFKIPRTEIDKCKDRPELKQSGVYFLFSDNDETDSRKVYVGQAGVRKTGEGLLQRIQEHRRNPEKDYWSQVVVFTTSNNSFGPTEISYLENRFCNLALEAHRYEVQNENDPSPGNITEEKESEMEEFIDYSKIVMGALGFKVFEPLHSIEKIDDTEQPAENDNPETQPMLYLKRNVKDVGLVKAFGIQTSDGFVLLKGSFISPIADNSVSDLIKKKRDVALIDENRILQEDILLGSPSTAAVFAIGKSENGTTRWRDKNNRSLKDIEQEKYLESSGEKI